MTTALTTKKNAAALQRLAEKVLLAIPQSRQGFLRIIEHMGNFSSGFATAASRATSAREQIAADGEMGLTPLRADLRKVYRDIQGGFTSLAELIEQTQAFTASLEEVVSWSLLVEQDAFLPQVAEQLKGLEGEQLELKTLGAIVDNLMAQTRPLIHEAISSSQQASDAIGLLTRRLQRDLDASRFGMEKIRQHTDATLTRIGRIVKSIDQACGRMEGQATGSHTVVFEMVQAMQYDDITAQRLEHVAQVLHIVAERLLKQDKLDDATRRWCFLALRMTVDQCEETSADLITATQTIHAQLTQLLDIAVDQANAIGLVRREGIRFRQENADVAYQLGAIMSLGIFNETLAIDVLRAFSQGENALIQIKRALSALEQAAARLNRLVASMSVHGNPSLEILVSSIQELAQRIMREAPVRLGFLSEAITRVEGFNQLFSEKINPRLMRTATLLRRIPLATQQMESNNAALVSGMNDTLGGAQATTIQIMLVAAEMVFQHQVKIILETSVDEIQSLLPAIGGAHAATLGGNLNLLAGEFSDLAGLYTMEKERRIHQAVLEGATLAEERAENDEPGFELF